jgi:hypothetical protein
MLVTAPLEDRKWIYDDYEVTAVTTSSEYLTEDFALTSVMDGHLKQYPTPS